MADSGLIPLFGRKRGSGCQAACSLLAMIALALPAWAGDTTVFRPIGYADDGQTFVFEEYAEPGDSGYAFAALRRVDLARNRMDAVPLGIVAEEQQASTVAAARARAAEQASSWHGLTSLGPTYRVLASQPPMEIDSDPLRVRFGRPAETSAIEADEIFALQAWVGDAETSSDCVAVTGRPAANFRLSLVNEGSGESRQVDATQLVATYAESCPLGYRIEDVFMPWKGSPAPFLAVTVAVMLPRSEIRYLVVGIPF